MQQYYYRTAGGHTAFHTATAAARKRSPTLNEGNNDNAPTPMRSSASCNRLSSFSTWSPNEDRLEKVAMVIGDVLSLPAREKSVLCVPKRYAAAVCSSELNCVSHVVGVCEYEKPVCSPVTLSVDDRVPCTENGSCGSVSFRPFALSVSLSEGGGRE